ncbi:hypothetical protein ACLOAU_02500 [Niabella sp. CJ426]|uniref:hypothetical protein n=1 Tax=Niabella sp. CJ426 TaxID=3393740 RepID=UPI003CFF240C
MKKILFSAALMMGFAVVSVAGTPKSESKPTETQSTNKSGQSLYWYDVVYDGSHQDGYVPNGTTPEQGERSEMEGDCPQGEAKLCKVGFQSQQTLPISSENLGNATENITRSN